MASNFLAIQTQIRDLNGLLLYYSADFRRENNFRVARRGGRGAGGVVKML